VKWQLLERVPEESVQRLLQIACRRRFRRGEVVFHRGDPADSLHLVTKGRFAIRVMTPLGDQATLALRGPGESFGEMALVGAKTSRAATVEALEPAETFCVYETEFALLRREHPAVNELLISLLAAEVRSMDERLLERSISRSSAVCCGDWASWRSSTGAVRATSSRSR
jgi:CRP/FNR family transcriptional regulator, cyclic AMP receptor protein